MNLSVHKGRDLLRAVETGDIDKVTNLLQIQVNPNFSSSDNGGELRSALHRASAYGHLKIINALLEHGADVEITSSSGRLPLHEACIGGHPQLVKVLVRYNNKLDHQDANGQTPCHLAALNGEVECVKILLEQVAQSLHHLGCDPLLGDKDGKSVAHVACIRDQFEVLKLLFHAGVDMQVTDEKGRFPMHTAAAHGSIHALKALVNFDCDVSAKDHLACQPLHCAAAHNKLNCVQYLGKQGAKLQALDGAGRSALHYAAKHGAVDVVHWLAETKVHLDVQDDNGETPLHSAALNGKGNCANCLLQHDANSEIKTNQGYSVVQCARSAGYPKLMEDVFENVVACPICFKQFDFFKWEKKNQPDKVKRYLNDASSGYKLPDTRSKLTKLPTFLEKNRQKRDKILLEKSKRENKLKLKERELTMKYFGDYPQEMKDRLHSN